ncbi:hypothetical protein BC831DRAFT_474583 [Entophlyctis helioformis]|nr:hypothetical protein BC831DRAFT_474583 [Entophlyctis helioformis]
MLRIPPHLVSSSPIAILGLVATIISFGVAIAGSAYFAIRARRSTWTAMLAGLFISNFVSALLQVSEAAFVYTDTSTTYVFLIARNYTFGLTALALALVEVEIGIMFSVGLALNSFLVPRRRRSFFVAIVVLNLATFGASYMEGIVFSPRENGQGTSGLDTVIAYGPSVFSAIIGQVCIIGNLYILYHVRKHMRKIMRLRRPSFRTAKAKSVHRDTQPAAVLGTKKSDSLEILSQDSATPANTPSTLPMPPSGAALEAPAAAPGAAPRPLPVMPKRHGLGISRYSTNRVSVMPESQQHAISTAKSIVRNADPRRTSMLPDMLASMLQNSADSRYILVDIDILLLALCVVYILATTAFVVSLLPSTASPQAKLINQSALRQISFALGCVHLCGQTIVVTVVSDRARSSSAKSVSSSASSGFSDATPASASAAGATTAVVEQ